MKTGSEKLNSNKTEGEKIRLNCFRNGKDEAGVSDIIENELKKIFIQQYCCQLEQYFRRENLRKDF